MSDDKQDIVQQPRGAATRYHDVDEDRPQCGTPIKLGEWTILPIEEMPDDFDRCQRCAGEVEQSPDEGESILSRTRHGSPEDFGLEEIPEQRKRKWTKGNDT